MSDFYSCLMSFLFRKLRQLWISLPDLIKPNRNRLQDFLTLRYNLEAIAQVNLNPLLLHSPGESFMSMSLFGKEGWWSTIGAGEIVLFVISSTIVLGVLLGIRWIINKSSGETNHDTMIQCPGCGNVDRVLPTDNNVIGIDPRSSIVTIPYDEDDDSTANQFDYWCSKCGEYW